MAPLKKRTTEVFLPNYWPAIGACEAVVKRLERASGTDLEGGCEFSHGQSTFWRDYGSHLSRVESRTVPRNDIRWLGDSVGPIFATNTSPSATGAERGDKRLQRGCFGGGPAMAGLGPLLFLFCRSGRRRRRWVQCYPRSGALALRKGVVSGWTGVPSRLLRRLRVTGSSYGAGALGQEVSHGLGRLLCLSEAFSKPFDRRSKEAAGGNRGIKEGNLICVLDLRQCEPQVALEHH